MTDDGTQTPSLDADQQGGGDQDSGKEFKAPANQAELNAIIKQRVDRERAKFADYNDLKTKAAELDQIKRANQTEAEKTNERIASLEQELTATKTSALRSRIQAKHGISDEDAELFLTATDEETLAKQAERLAAREADRKKSGNHVPHEGRTPNDAGNSSDREVVKSLFGGD